MKAIILAGGRGKRLRPITDKIPKPLIPINNKPLIERTIKYLKKYGITEIVISSGYKSCLLYTSPSPRDMRRSRMPSSA